MEFNRRRGLAAVVALAVGCIRAGAARAAEAKVRIDNFTFSPEVLTVQAGTLVTFANEDDIPHTVVAVDRSFRSKPLDTGDAFSFTFSSPGEFDYFCSLHPHMKAKVIVTK